MSSPWRLAHLAEHGFDKAAVVGSNPTAPTNSQNKIKKLRHI
jgi:hypothetical protein